MINTYGDERTVHIVIRLNIPNADSHIQKIVDDSTYVPQKYYRPSYPSLIIRTQENTPLYNLCQQLH